MKKLFAILFSLVFSQVVYCQSDSVRTKSNYLGFNISRMLVGDFELELRRKLTDHFMVGISVGYDFNFLDKQFTYDYGTRNDPAFPSESKESMTSPERRYWWGEGIAGRMQIDYTFKEKRDRQHFISLEGLLKERDYTDHYYGEQRVVILESADQVIGGVTLYYGTNRKISKHLISRFHIGVGFRTLNSNVKRPAYTFDMTYHPPSELNNILTIPSFHLGITILTGF